MSGASETRGAPVAAGSVSVVLPIWNSSQWLPGCLEALALQTRSFRLVVVDSASTDDSIEIVRRAAPDAAIVRLDRNRGFSAAANAGIAATRTPFVALLNADTRAEAGWLAALVDTLADGPDELWAVAPCMLRMELPDQIDDAGNLLTRYGTAIKRGHGEPAGRYQQAADVFSVSGGASLFRRRVLDELGGFDESHESYFEDVDLGLRARLAGYRALYVPEARVLHQGGGSGLPRARYVRLVTANRLATVLGCWPRQLLVRHALRLLWAQVYFLLAYRRPLASAAGLLRLARRLRGIRHRRRALLPRVRITAAELDAQLHPRLGEPKLRHLVARRLRGAG